MRKHVIAMSLAAALVCSMTACGSGNGEIKASTQAQTESSVSGTESKESSDSSAAWKPEENVNMIVAYKAGSGTDNTARVLSQYASKYIGKTIVIDNQEGGSGSIGWTALANAKPDGYTLGFVNLPTLCSNIVDGLANYKMEDYVPLCNHVNETAMVMVAADSPFDKLEDLVAYAKEHPGELKASTNGNKASNHIGAQLLASTADFEYTDIPYGGTAVGFASGRG